jgi:hypothetical protein
MRLRLGAYTGALLAGTLLAGILFAANGADAASATTPAANASDDANLIETAAHVNRTPKQSWPGYGVYLGNGLVLTASHVPGPFLRFQPHVIVGGRDFPTSLVKEGTIDTVDLTILRFDPSTLPMRLRLRRTPLCEGDPEPGKAVVVATPEGVARSRVLRPEAIPPEFRARFGASTIPDVATTGNSGSGVFDAWRQCLLGVMSRKFTVELRGAPPRKVDIAKYFVPAEEIRAFLPPGVTF